MLSVTLNNVDTELQENREKIKILTENNKALTLKVDTLSKNIDNKKMLSLQELVEYQAGQVVSKTLVQNELVSVTVLIIQKNTPKTC